MTAPEESSVATANPALDTTTPPTTLLSFEARRDQAILEALRIQSIRAPLPMFITIIVIAGMSINSAPPLLAVAWAAVAISIQYLRYFLTHRWVKKYERNPRQGLRQATLLALGNGLIIASSVGFFYYNDTNTNAIHTMIMIGVFSGTLATSHGYRPVCLGFVGTNLLALMLGWTLMDKSETGNAQAMLIVLLLIVLAAVLYRSAKDIFSSFGDIFLVNQKLEVALEAEKSAHASKTRFLAAASHDLRQPLHALSMLSSALNSRQLDQQSANIANRINGAVTDLSSELDSLLDLSKLDAGIVEPQNEWIESRELLQRLLTHYKVQALDKGLQFDLQFHHNPTVEVDRILFERLVRNLLDNAIKYTDAGRISVAIEQRKDQCVISISDTGIGIPASDHLRVREEFYQRHNPERDRNKGLGLGLSIVWRIAPLIGASLDMTSRPGAGTRFEIQLPCRTPLKNTADEYSTQETDHSVRRASQTQITAQHNPPSDDYLMNTNILMLEDDKAVRFSTRTVLEEHGVTVYEAINTEEAADIVRNLELDVALVDIRLPGDDNGFKAVAAIRAIKADLPIILISGETTPDQIAKANKVGCELLVKPVAPQRMLDSMALEIQRARAS